MDLVRSCYSTDMQFDAEGTIVRRVRWYFVPPDTPIFPYQHAFGSAIYGPQGYFPIGLGEQPLEHRPYRTGKVPWYQLTPRKPCGQESWWIDGVPPGTPDLRRGTLGQPVCCQRGSGIYIGGSSTYKVLPINKGGILLGGRSNPYLRTPSTGGVLLGGRSSPHIHAPGTGGVLLGGRSAPYVRGPSTGGVLLGAMSAPYVRGPSKGGVLLGGTSAPVVRDRSTGGVLLGATSAPYVRGPSKGGVLLGGTSAPYVLCQPWAEYDYLVGYCRNVATGYNWTVTSIDPTATEWNDDGLDMAVIYAAQTGTSCAEGPFGTSCIMLAYSTGFEYTMKLVSFNRETLVGRWQVPATCPVYTGLYFDLYFG